MAIASSGQQFHRESGRDFSTIALLRFLHGWSQRELAEHAGVSKRTIASAETGEHAPLLETRLALAKALGVDDVEELLQALDEMLNQSRHDHDEQLHRHRVARGVCDALQGPGPWTIDAERSDLEQLLTSRRDMARSSVEANTIVAKLPRVDGAEAQRQRNAYNDARLEAMTVYDALLLRLLQV